MKTTIKGQSSEDNRLSDFNDTGNISHNGAFKQNETLPHYATKSAMRIPCEVNSGQLGESINDGSPEFVAQTFETCLETSEYMPEAEMPMLKRLLRSVENRYKKVQLRIQNKDRRAAYNSKQVNTTALTSKHKLGV